MKSDLSLMIDDIRLNIRVGIIFRYNNKTLIEVLKTREGNSVIPGGRVKIDELCVDSLKREIKEEMHCELVDEKISFIKNLEYFYEFNGEKVHELFFVYKYSMDEADYLNLQKVKENQDTHLTDYLFISDDEFTKYNLLPLEVIDIIKNCY